MVEEHPLKDILYIPAGFNKYFDNKRKKFILFYENIPTLKVINNKIYDGFSFLDNIDKFQKLKTNNIDNIYIENSKFNEIFIENSKNSIIKNSKIDILTPKKTYLDIENSKFALVLTEGSQLTIKKNTLVKNFYSFDFSELSIDNTSKIYNFFYKESNKDILEDISKYIKNNINLDLLKDPDKYCKLIISNSDFDNYESKYIKDKERYNISPKDITFKNLYLKIENSKLELYNINLDNLIIEGSNTEIIISDSSIKNLFSISTPENSIELYILGNTKINNLFIKYNKTYLGKSEIYFLYNFSSKIGIKNANIYALYQYYNVFNTHDFMLLNKNYKIGNIIINQGIYKHTNKNIKKPILKTLNDYLKTLKYLSSICESMYFL